MHILMRCIFSVKVSIMEIEVLHMTKTNVQLLAMYPDASMVKSAQQGNTYT